MGTPNKDEVEGKFDQAKGSLKENVGRAVGDRDMEAEGTADRAEGNLQEGFGTDEDAARAQTRVVDLRAVLRYPRAHERAHQPAGRAARARPGERRHQR